MTTTIFHKIYNVIKRITPSILHKFLRSFFTAVFTPIRFSIKKGHFKSSIQVKAVDRFGEPIPWYTYPCVDFLKFRMLKNVNILEFGAGQSTLWWGKNASTVISFEGNKEWYNYLKNRMPANVSLFLPNDNNPESCISDINAILSEKRGIKFDIVIIDGLWRAELIDIAKKFLTPNGAIICDNSEGYGFYDGFKDDNQFQKVDFYGYAAGCILQSCTTIYFRADCILFKSDVPTLNIEEY